MISELFIQPRVPHHLEVSEKEFDIFSRAYRPTWQYECSLKAESPEKAKRIFMTKNAINDPLKVAVYLKR
jgi:hypothetical protein